MILCVPRCALEYADVSSCQTGSGQLFSRQAERQGQRVPVAILVERAVLQVDNGVFISHEIGLPHLPIHIRLAGTVNLTAYIDRAELNGTIDIAEVNR